MPNIRTYDAPTERLSPDNRGNSAFETAARRIGPLYGQAADDIKSAAAAKARSLKDDEWPFSIADLEASLDDVRARRDVTTGSGGGGGTESFKVAGDINSFFKGGKGASGGGSSGSKGASSSGKTTSSDRSGSSSPSKTYRDVPTNDGPSPDSVPIGTIPWLSSDRAGAEIAGAAAGLTRLTRHLWGVPDGEGLVKVGPGQYGPATAKTPGFHGSKVDLSNPDDMIIPGFTGKRGDLGVTGEDTGMKYPLPNGYQPSPIGDATAQDISNQSQRSGVNVEELPGSVPAGADTGVSPSIPDVDSGHWWDSYIPSFPWSDSSDSAPQEVTAPIPSSDRSGDYGGGGDYGDSSDYGGGNYGGGGDF